MELESLDISPFYKIKALVCGNQGVGKSTLVKLFIEDIPDKSIAATIGMEFAHLVYELEEYKLEETPPSFYFKAKGETYDKNKNVNNQTVSIHVWDASGDMRYVSIVNSYLRDVDIAFLVFDISDRKSWDDLRLWKEKLENNSKFTKIPMLIIVACKMDLKSHAVEIDEIIQRAKEWNAQRYSFSCYHDYAPHMIKRMLYQSILVYHKYLLELKKRGEILPEYVTSSFYKKKRNTVDLGITETTSYCCYL